MQRTKFKYYSVLFSLLFLTSCSKYLDTVKTTSVIPVNQGFFNFYPDSNMFLYSNSVLLTRDTESIYPKSFSVKLPKKIKYYEIISSSNFAFYYGKGEVIFIKVDLKNTILLKDTILNPLQEEIEHFIEYELNTTNNNRYNIKNIPFYKNKKCSLIKKNNATILLYNIKKKNYDHFYDLVRAFRFL